MSDSSKRKRPLVADKRYASAKPKPAARKAAPKKARAPRRPKRGGFIGFVMAVLAWVLRLLWKLTWRSAVVGVLLLAMAVDYVFLTLPSLDKLLDGRARGSVTLLDREGDTFAWRGDQFGGAVSAQTVSRHLKNAVVASEDKRFYRHVGISPRGIASAVRINLREGRGPLSGHGGF